MHSFIDSFISSFMHGHYGCLHVKYMAAIEFLCPSPNSHRLLSLSHSFSLHFCRSVAPYIASTMNVEITNIGGKLPVGGHSPVHEVRNRGVQRTVTVQLRWSYIYIHLSVVVWWYTIIHPPYVKIIWIDAGSTSRRHLVTTDKHLHNWFFTSDKF